MTYLAFSFCDLEWWHAALAWLLPFILGLLLGYAIWAKYKKMKEDLEGDIRGLKKKISGLEADLDACHHSKVDLDSEIALLKGQLRERNLQISTLSATLEAANAKGKGKTKEKEKDKPKGKGGKAAAIAGGAGLAAGLTPSKNKKDDLKKVEGIGPKIEGLLNDDGIRTFADLANAGVSRLQRILDDAGPRYRISNPETWPDQAALARDGKWDELKVLQDNLKGGRKK